MEKPVAAVADAKLAAAAAAAAAAVVVAVVVVVVVIVFAAEAADVPFVAVAAPAGIVAVGSRP